MKICFLLAHVPNPRFNKRISVAKECGEVAVICVRRHSGDLFEPYFDDVPHTIFNIDFPSSAQPVKRYFTTRGFERQALQSLEQERPDLIYAGGFNGLLIAVKYRQKHPATRVFCEVGDLREIFIEEPRSAKQKLLKKVLQRMENRCLGDLEQLIVTSELFYENYYRRLLPPEKVLFIPNLPDLSAFRDYRKKADGPFTVGFIGGIRYVRQMHLLVDAAEQAGVNVLFAGGSNTQEDLDDITAYCQDKPFVRFSGRYDYNRDIAGLYGSVDCVFAVYDADNPNVRIALPNKLYEATYCGLPILVAKDTYLAQLVDEWGVGIAVSHKDPTELTAVLKKLKNNSSYYESFVQNCLAKKPDINYTIYQNALKGRIKKVLSED